MNGPTPLTPWRRTVDKLLAAQRLAAAAVQAARADVDNAKARQAAVAEAQAAAQQLAQQTQQAAHAGLASVVSRCLSAVFDEPYDFRIAFEQKRGRTEARLTFYRDGHEHDPMTASGGGVVDVAAFALRLAALTLAQPPARRVLFLDEPFRFVHSPLYRRRVRQLLERLADDMGVQIIMVTGVAELQTGQVVELG